MLVKELLERNDFGLFTEGNNVEKEIKGVYINDLLSYVMSHSSEGDIWVTVQIHPNIIAVAELVGISAIIVPEGIKVEDITVEKANEKGIEILTTELDAYKICKVFMEYGL